MIIEQQESEIRNYLLSKKLPIDILIEVNDHFVSQISDLQREENLSFEEAFEKTKENWQLVNCTRRRKIDPHHGKTKRIRRKYQ